MSVARRVRTPGLAIAVAVAFASATVPVRAAFAQDARADFARGREAFLAQRYEEALGAFRAAQTAARSPNTGLYIARCLRETGHLAEAHDAFVEAAAEARTRAVAEPRYEATATAAQSEASALEARLARLQLMFATPPDAQTTVTIGGRAIAVDALVAPVWVDAGEVVVSVRRTAGDRSFGDRLVIAAGSTAEIAVPPLEQPVAPVEPVVVAASPVASAPASPVTIDPERPAVIVTRGGGVRVAGIVVGSVGVAAMITFTVSAALAKAQYDALAQDASSGVVTDRDARIDNGVMLQTLANTSLGVGLGLLVAGGVMIAVGGPRLVNEREHEHTAAVLPWGGALAGGQGGVAGVALRF